MCLLWVGEFSGSHLRLRTTSYTFTGLHRWTHIYNQKYRVFHPREYLTLLATTQHKFSCSTNSRTPLNFVQRIILINHQGWCVMAPFHTLRTEKLRLNSFNVSSPLNSHQGWCVMTPCTYTYECVASMHMQCIMPLHVNSLSHMYCMSYG